MSFSILFGQITAAVNIVLFNMGNLFQKWLFRNDLENVAQNSKNVEVGVSVSKIWCHCFWWNFRMENAMNFRMENTIVTR